MLSLCNILNAHLRTGRF